MFYAVIPLVLVSGIIYFFNILMIIGIFDCFENELSYEY